MLSCTICNDSCSSEMMFCLGTICFTWPWYQEGHIKKTWNICSYFKIVSVGTCSDKEALSKHYSLEKVGNVLQWIFSKSWSTVSGIFLQSLLKAPCLGFLSRELWRYEHSIPFSKTVKYYLQFSMERTSVILNICYSWYHN